MEPLILDVRREDTAVMAAQALSSGGVILFPTDTLYGLGADALSDEAVAKIYAVKGRDEGKPIHCVVADLDMAERFAEVDELARMLAERFLPGALTLILKKKQGIETGIAKGIDTFGIRIPDHPFCRAISEKFGGPITATSANRSGMHSMRTVPAILEQLGENAAHISLAVDAGEILARAPSTVVDLSGARPVILREGAISSGDVWEALSPLDL